MKPTTLGFVALVTLSACSQKEAAPVSPQLTLSSGVKQANALKKFDKVCADLTETGAAMRNGLELLTPEEDAARQAAQKDQGCVETNTIMGIAPEQPDSSVKGSSAPKAD